MPSRIDSMKSFRNNAEKIEKSTITFTVTTKSI